jgi:cytochrome c oxidase assembly factor CtaG
MYVLTVHDFLTIRFLLSLASFTWRVVVHPPKRGGDVMVQARICTISLVACVMIAS